MPRTEDAEITPVECGDRLHIQPFAKRHNAAVHDVKTRIGVGLGDLLHAWQICL